MTSTTLDLFAPVSPCSGAERFGGRESAPLRCAAKRSFSVLKVSVGLCLVVICSLLISAPAAAADPDPQAPLTVTEWVIFLCDPNVKQANDSSLFQSTLPDFAASRRPSGPPDHADAPGPMGVIRLSGGAADERVDVLLNTKLGKFLAHWPRAQQRTSAILWGNLEPKTTGGTPEPVLPGNWFHQLRDPAGPFWTRDGKGERFVLYDAEIPYTLPLKLSASGDGVYGLRNIGPAPLRDVTLYQNRPDGWHTAMLPLLPTSPKRASTRPATKPATTRSSTAPATARRAAATTVPATATTTAASMPAATVAVTTRPATGPTTQPAVTLSLGGPALADAHAATALWADRLSAAGLPPTDYELIFSILQKHALDPKRTTAVYRLDPTELDRLLPLEVTPQPKSTVRIGLVIAINIDPAIGDEVNRLIASLGDDDWQKRETAYKQLAKLGVPAKPKLQAALKSMDLEVVYRAEKLIQLLAPVPQPNAQPTPQ